MLNPQKSFWNFLLNQKDTLSRSVYKKAILRGQLALLAISVGITYIVIDNLNGIYFNLRYYFFLIAFSAGTIYLNRNGKFELANNVFLLLLNCLIYVFAANDTYRSGVYIYFMVCALTSLTLCGYEQLKTGLFFCSLSLLLFMLAYIFKVYPSLPHAEVPESYVTIAFITNFTVSLITTATLLFFLLDINFRTEEELLKNNELLTKANKELDRFVYSASHDLRSPLSSMLGLIEIAKRSDSLEEINTCLSLMADRIKVQDSFIKDIVEYARNSRVSISSEKIQVNAFIKEIVNQLKYNEGAQEIDFQIQIDDNSYINGDRSRLTSILFNLISNAIKYHDKTKPSQFIRISLVTSEYKAELSVEDNGIGIPTDLQGKIFDMFFRASEISKGSGLGLFIVKETIERMGGSISLRSHFGKGTCFTISLPNSVPVH
ncbi:MAG: HAMP domain-containing sensor histidine kinase [Bacteroidota bacterium]